MTAPAPYYSADGVTLYHGDARECEAWLAADVLVTDPPYGISWKRSANAARQSKAHAGIANDEDTAARDDVLKAWGDRPAIVFGSVYLAPAPGTKHVCVWEKPGDAGVVGSTLGFRRDLEAVYLCGRWPQLPPRWGSVVRSAAPSSGNPHSTAGKTGHPHSKPVDLMCLLLERAPVGVIADPFAGSGSTLVAAAMCGRTAIGVEIDERYCEVVARRLAQGSLFAGAAA